MPRKSTNQNNQKIAFDFFRWAFAKGDTIADELDYVPLSAEEKNKIIKEWNIE